LKPSSKNAGWLQKLKDEGITSGSRTLERRPVLFLSVQWAWKAYDTLNRQRQVGQTGPQPVTIEAIAAYCSVLRLSPDKSFFLVDLIPQMDGIFLSDFHKRNKPPKGKK
jgi:hypothetical protein